MIFVHLFSLHIFFINYFFLSTYKPFHFYLIVIICVEPSIAEKIIMEDEEEIIYGVTEPARNIPELALATLTLINSLEENEEKNEDLIFKYLDTYVKESSLSPISFKNIDLEWFNVSQPLNFEEELSSHIVVLDFFTYCCINCLHILPDLDALEENFIPNNSPVIVIGIHSAKFDNERSTKGVSDALKRYNISHPVANDVKCKLWHNLGISCWPTLLITGPNGLPLFVLMGEGKKDLLFKFVENSLKYFDNMTSLEPKHLPLLPHLHLPSEGSGLYYPGKIHSYPEGLIISDSGNNRILITDYEGNIRHWIGCMKRGFIDGSFDVAAFNNPQGVVYHPTGVVYVADTDNHAIRKLDLQTNTVSTIAGIGTQGYDKEGGLLWANQAISSPWDLCLGRSLDVTREAHPNILFIAMAGLHQIWGIFLSSGLWLKKRQYPEGTVMALAGSGLEENRNTSYPLRAGFAQPSGIDVWNSPEGQIIFIADSESSSIRQFSLIDGSVKKVSGGSVNPMDLFAFGDEDGDSHSAMFQHPLGVAVAGGHIYVADSYNHKVKMLKRIDKKNFETQTVIGEDCNMVQKGSDLCKLSEPGGICCSQNGKRIYIADTNNFCIKEYTIEQRIVREVNIKFVCEGNEDFYDSRGSIEVSLPPGNVRVNLIVKLNIPDKVHFTPSMDQKYSLKFKGAIYSKNSEGSLTYETKIPVEVDFSLEHRAELQLTTKLFLCSEEDACFMDKNLTSITFVAQEGEYPPEIDVDVKINTKL